MSDFEARAQQWALPISEDAPAGENARYVDAYEQVKTEKRKLTSMDGTQPDWALAVQLADKITRETTKDTTMLSILCVGLFHTERYAGLAAGLLAFRQIVESYWDEMHPPARRLKGRANDYAWMVGQLTDMVPETIPEPSELEALRACHEGFGALDMTLRERLGDMHPAVGQLKRTLGGYTEQLAATVAPPAAEEPAVSDGGGGAAWEGEKTPPDPTPFPGGLDPSAVAAMAAAAAGGTTLPDAILNEQQAELVVEKATKALRMAAEFYQRRAEDLEEEKKRLEERLRHAHKIVKLEKKMVDMMSRTGEDEEEEDSD